MLNPDYRDILSAFIAEQVEYLLVGAYALAAHGAPRATGDIDLWVRPTPENARRAWRALARFGAPLGEVSEDDLATPGRVVQVGTAPRRERVEVVVDGLPVAVIGREHFLRNKRALGRPRDQADIEALGEG